ncbi:endoglucanase-5 [Diaporthe eres]|nr:endoglucanase-5 [Diaporthe eres]
MSRPCILSLTAILAEIARAASGTGSSTRYWDCCKPSCAWPGKADVTNPPYTCDINDNPLSNYEAVSGCQSGGTAFTCTNQAPWAANSLISYGFAATAISGGTEASWCCACYALTFTSGKAKGKVMLVQSVNTGGDLSGNQFDLQIPGGGTGIFDGCTTEFGSSWGAQYGGISNRSECSALPAKLQAGCDWRFDWFGNADNPTHTFTQISCPAELTGVTGCVRNDDASFPKYVMPSPATWTAPSPTATAAAYAQCDSLTWDVAMLVGASKYVSSPLESMPQEFAPWNLPLLLAVRSRNRTVFFVIDRIDPEEQQHKLQFQVHPRGFNFFVFLLKICHDGNYPFDYLACYDNHCDWGFDADQVWAMRWERLDRTNCLSSGEHMLNG